jgi:hypothetical protein
MIFYGEFSPFFKHRKGPSTIINNFISPNVSDDFPRTKVYIVIGLFSTMLHAIHHILE